MARSGVPQEASALPQLRQFLQAFHPELRSGSRASHSPHLFTSAPILIHPDTSKQFIVEVDASDAGVGAVLSQRLDSPGRLQPCAFFSCRLTPSEKNYDVGDKELLAIKLALEDWRHWLEGAKQPFLILTDHKNLIYLRTAKRLNSRQARWSLFFTRFNFTLSYRPGSRNVKPDALSRQYSLDADSSPPATVLPAACVVGPSPGT